MLTNSREAGAGAWHNAPMSESDLRGLDNPFWTCLATRHAHIAQGDALARRYLPQISVLAGVSGIASENVAALTSLVDVGDDVALVGTHVPELPGAWENLYVSELTQMLRAERSPLPEGNADVATLGPTDVPEMQALVELTHPGPFRARTIELGIYIGIRDRGRLVAMAGERTWIGDFREVSAVCTHPEAQGRGYARMLISRVVNRMLRAGQTPFLHAETKNEVAIEVYQRLGFIERTRLPLLYARKVA
jgi:ribosomal protein S18 acetylase RimI-like enzyme